MLHDLKWTCRGSISSRFSVYLSLHLDFYYPSYAYQKETLMSTFLAFSRCNSYSSHTHLGKKTYKFSLATSHSFISLSSLSYHNSLLFTRHTLHLYNCPFFSFGAVRSRDNTLCRPSWLGTPWSACLCFQSTGMKGVCHHSWTKFLL